MHHYLLSGLAFIASAFSAFSQYSINWGPDISVANGSVYGNIRPRLALTTGNVPVVIFGRNGGAVHIAKWNGTAFDTPVNILPAGVLTYLANWTGPDIAAHGDTIIATFKALPFETGKVYAVRSTDGGLTYSDTIRVDDHETGRVFLPAINMDENGQPVIDYMAFDGISTAPRYIVTHSSDAGLTFSPGVAVTLMNAGEACDCCPAEIVTGGNRQALLYRNNIGNTRDIYSVYSTDNGVTFDWGGNMEELNWHVTSCPSTGPHGIFYGDSLYSVSTSRVSGSNRIYIGASSATSTLDFQYLVSPVPPTNANGSQNYPRITGEGDTM